MSRFGPYTRRICWGKLDGRSREARLLRDTRHSLIEHCGGIPNAVQSAMIDQICQLTLRINAMDKKFAESGALTDHDTRTYLAWSNSLVRLLRDLGVKQQPVKPPSLVEILRPAAKAERPAR